jgi:hypothetical protein
MSYQEFAYSVLLEEKEEKKQSKFGRKLATAAGTAAGGVIGKETLTPTTGLRSEALGATIGERAALHTLHKSNYPSVLKNKSKEEVHNAIKEKHRRMKGTLKSAKKYAKAEKNLNIGKMLKHGGKTALSFIGAGSAEKRIPDKILKIGEKGAKIGRVIGRAGHVGKYALAGGTAAYGLSRAAEKLRKKKED